MEAKAPSIETIFCEAIELSSAEERAAYLDRACGDAEVRRQVEGLVAAHFRAGGFLESPALAETAAAPAPAEPSPTAEGHGTVVGPYTLLERIGEGGMGTVYMAEQAEPVRRKVALKLIKPGMDSKQVIARFEAERQALAMMDHPNIARVLDAGTTDAGRPYFVMELVRGIPITDYCDRAQLSIPDRLELFTLVCRAVQHAHQKGIIHRDLKPTNVLVTLHDGVPVPKVIDFGIAKATGQSLTDKTLFTGFAQMIGTPLYMSPEQAELSGLDVDTRSDVYSLGVLLYELLTGTTPFDRETFGQAALDEIRWIIREQEPPTPSSRLSTLGETATAVSAARHTDPRRLGQLMRGELDWIVMRSLEKDRRRRYESAGAFAADVRRHLDGEAVEAHPPSAWYRFGKFSRRHRAALTTAGVAAAALLLGTAVSTWQAVRATRAEQQAEAALSRVAAAQARTAAAQARAEANFQQARQAVDDYLTTVSENRLLNEPGMQPLRQELLKTALIYYQGFIEKRGDDPSLRAELAEAHMRVGAISESVPGHRDAYQAAAAIYRELAAENPEVADYQDGLVQCYTSLGWLYHHIVRDYALAEEEFQRAIAIGNRAVATHPDATELRYHSARAYSHFGDLRRTTGDLEAAERSHRQGIAILRRLVEEHPDAADYQQGLALGHDSLGGVQKASGDLEAAEQSLQRALAIRRQLVEAHPDDFQDRNNLASSYNSLGHVQRNAGDLEAAERTVQQAIDIGEELIEENPGVVTYRHNLATSYQNLGMIQQGAGDLEAAVQSLERAIEQSTRVLETHPDVRPFKTAPSYSFYRMAEVLCTAPDADLRDPERAVEAARRAVELNPEGGGNWKILSLAHYRNGDFDAAVEAAEKAIEIRGHGYSFDWLILALAHARRGEMEEAREWFAKLPPRSDPAGMADAAGSLYQEAAMLLGPSDASADGGDEPPGSGSDAKPPDDEQTASKPGH